MLLLFFIEYAKEIIMIFFFFEVSIGTLYVAIMTQERPNATEIVEYRNYQTRAVPNEIIKGGEML